MNSISGINLNNSSRILLFSQRNIHKKLNFESSLFEFEDIIREIDSVELLAPKPNNWFKYGSRISQRIAKKYAITLNSGISKLKVKKKYDLFFAFCQSAKDLLHVESVEGWRDYCETAICLLNEFYAFEVYSNKGFLNILSKFDYVIVNCSQSVDAIEKEIGVKCFYFPPAVDAILFCPYPNVHQRVIDVYSIGRRSERTHRSLLKMARENEIFYVYDTIDSRQVFSTSEHRYLFANMAKRSKYFIVNPGKINAPDQTNNQSEIGARYFEGAASGTIMIGEYPNNKEFTKIFNWADAVIHLPFDSENIDTIINELEKQSQRQEKIRKNNVITSLKQYDWVYCWESVLQFAGLEPLPELLERKKRLKDLADMIKKD